MGGERFLHTTGDRHPAAPTTASNSIQGPGRDDASAADDMFLILMGDKVEPRRGFIEKYVLEVKNLDVKLSLVVSDIKVVKMNIKVGHVGHKVCHEFRFPRPDGRQSRTLPRIHRKARAEGGKLALQHQKFGGRHNTCPFRHKRCQART